MSSIKFVVIVMIALQLMAGTSAVIRQGPSDDDDETPTVTSECRDAIVGACRSTAYETDDQMRRIYGDSVFSFRLTCTLATRLKECVDDVLVEQCSAEAKQQFENFGDYRIYSAIYQFVCVQHIDELEPVVNCLVDTYKASPGPVKNRLKECDSFRQKGPCRERLMFYCTADVAGQMCGSQASTLGHQLADVYVHQSRRCQLENRTEEAKRSGFVNVLKRVLKKFN
jgi:hypothetical protein